MALRTLPPAPFEWAGQRPTRVPADGYLKHAGSFYRAPTELVHQRVELRFSRDEVWISHRGAELARYPRSYEPGTWLPAPRVRLVPAPPPQAAYAELCR
jgi:Mu transposase, C-terminal domain